MAGTLALYQMFGDLAATQPEDQQQPRITASFWNDSGGTISDGDAVTFDLSTNTFGVGASIDTSAASADSVVIGVADEDIVDGSYGKVLIFGIKVDANVASGVAAGAALAQSAGAGRLEAVAAGTDLRVGVCLTLAAANVATIYVGI